MVITSWSSVFQNRNSATNYKTAIRPSVVRGEPSKTILFVRNLPFSLDDNDLFSLFSEHHFVKSAQLNRRNNGRSNGFGFVEFNSEEEAAESMALVNNLVVLGRQLMVMPAILKEPLSAEVVVTVKASSLPSTMDESHLAQLFQELEISSCSVQNDQYSTSQVGFIEFASQADATRAVAILNTTSFDNVNLSGEIIHDSVPSVPQRRYRNDKYSRSRPRHRAWKGRTYTGRPPPYARKQYVYPLPPFLLPTSYENIISSKEEIMDLEVEVQLRQLFNNLRLGGSEVMKGPLVQRQSALIFHNLLYAEETRMRVDIRQYDMHGVKFEHNQRKALYTIKVPGLAEKRPSVLRGDIVKAKLHGSDDGKIYDGYAHFVNLEDVHVSFHRDIHDLVSMGYKFDVQFTYNRTPLRKFHRAVDVSWELWQKLWCAPAISPQVRLSLQRLYGRVALNQEQQQALLTLLHSNTSVMVLHGPPGTGKTATLVEAILQIINRSPNSRILVCAPSNSAVDLVASHLIGMLPRGITMFRLNGFMRDYKSVDPQTLLEFCYKNQGAFDIHPVPKLKEFNLILSTCVSAGYLSSLGVENDHFTHIFVDEAGEALEPETLIPLSLANKNTSIVLAGDHKQLGPIVRSSTALQWRYDRSLMEHLLDQCADKFVCKLVRSYRAHPALMALYSKMFYEDQLINCANRAEVDSLLHWTELPNPKIPLMFIHSEGEEAREPDSPSWFNDSEKLIVFQTVKSLLRDRNLRLTTDDIGIITPYRKQVKKIEQYAHGKKKEIGKVGTVENFQGQERKVIILSLVRSRSQNLAHDAKFKLGFCDNPKRLNVAISRAKALLIIVGNGSLFGSHDPHWNYLLAHFLENKLFKGKIPTWHYQQKTTEQVSHEEGANDDLGWDDDCK